MTLRLATFNVENLFERDNALNTTTCERGLKGRLDRRSEQFRSSVALVDTLAGSLWAYWKLALRVAYYGRQGQRGSKDLNLALRRGDARRLEKALRIADDRKAHGDRLAPHERDGGLEDRRYAEVARNRPGPPDRCS